MSRLDELIRELCPNGIDTVPIGEVVNFEQPTKYIVKSTNYDDSFPIPVLTAGQSFILGYTDEQTGHYNASKENPVIIFDDFTGAFKWVDFTFKVKSSAIKMLTADEDKVLLRYIFHVMGHLGFTSSEHKRLWIGTYSSFEIPVPPLAVQREIVRILDYLTELTAELQAELQARRQQYEYYMHELLLLKNESSVTMLPLKDIVNSISSGKNKTRLSDGEYPVYGSTGIIAYTDEFVYGKTQILVARVGANAGYTHIAHGKYDVSDNTLIIDVKDSINLRYVYYQLCNIGLNKYAKGGGQPLVTAGQIKQVEIPVPNIDVQNKVVEFLDRFNSLCSDLSTGLPAEIEARQKQYEYYRDNLLAFKEVD